MDDLPRAWPALMDLDTAADYLQLRRGALLRVLARENVQAVDVGARLLRWRRRDLDDLVAHLPAYGSGRQAATSRPGEEGMDRVLAAVERRALARRGKTNRIRHEVRESRPAS
ncbi:hypothetical protein [Phenylobacterium zucineum]|uniref:hypothetical protein n=1 Tax=Phenylobacterium zucineum TaxID=284016 RepID=UPI00059DC5DC|nr:hypothetical protein [Phenylobacterium zucineum]